MLATTSISDPNQLEYNRRSASMKDYAVKRAVLSRDGTAQTENSTSSSTAASASHGEVGRGDDTEEVASVESESPNHTEPSGDSPTVYEREGDPTVLATDTPEEEKNKPHATSDSETKLDPAGARIMSSRRPEEKSATFDKSVSASMPQEECPAFRHVLSNDAKMKVSPHPSRGCIVGSSDEPVTSSFLHKENQNAPADFNDPLETKHRLQRFMLNRTQPHHDALRRGYERAVAGSFYGSNKPPRQQTFLLLSGPSGSGRRALAESALRQIVQERDGGYYLEGHYDSMKRPVPYSGLVMAFDSFTCQVRQRGPEAAETMSKSIYSRLGSGADICVLTDMIPSLRGILGCGREGSDHKRRTANNDDPIQRFVFAFRMFMRGITQDQPLVLVMQDLHFADRCSLDILTGIATDLQGRRLCLVGTCDDSLVTADSYLAKKLREMEDAGVQISNISLQGSLFKPPESSEELQSLLAEALTMDEKTEYDARTAGRLARLIQSQTDVKSWFLIIEFIQWLQESDLLCYRSLGDNECRWELSSPEELDVVIESSNNTDRNRFLVDKLERKLSEEARQVLKFCSCFGTNINPEFLEYVLGDPSFKTLEDLFQLGFIASRRSPNVNSACHGICYVFENEEMRQAAYRLIPDPELFHLEIGRRLWRKLSSEQLEEHLFVVLSQIYMGRRLITREKERVAIASLCLHAGKKAARSSTFRTAAVYLEMGIDLLLYSEEVGRPDHMRSRCWRDEYDLTLALHCAAAEMTMCCARFEDTHALLEPVIDNARTFDDKVQAYTTKMYTYSQQDQREECLDLGIYVLEQLGETFPRRMCHARLMQELASVGKLLRNKTNEQICSMAHISDIRKLNALQVLNFMILPALTQRPRLSTFVFLKMTKITMLHGLSVLASGTFGTYGMMYIGLTGDTQKGARFGDLALKLLDQFGVMQYLPRVYAAVYGCIHGWTNPMAEALPRLLHAYQVGMSNGDAEYGGLCGNLYCFLSLDCGINLGAICRMYKGVKESLVTARQTYILRMFVPTIQIIHHFMGLTPDPLDSKGDLIDLDEYQTAMAGRRLCIVDLKHSRMMLCFVFGDIAQAKKFIITDDEIAQTPPTYNRVSYMFYSGLVNVAVARGERGGGRRGWKYVAGAKKASSRFQKLGPASPDNCLDKSYLIQAEVASLLGKDAKAIVEKYLCAIALAGEKGDWFMHALSNELLARHHLRVQGPNNKNDDKAALYLGRAMSSYKKWGGMAKVQRLQDELRSLYGKHSS